MSKLMQSLDPATTPRGPWRKVRNWAAAIAVVSTAILTGGAALPVWAITGLTVLATGSGALSGLALFKKGDKEVKEVEARKVERKQNRDNRKAARSARKG